jgi:hypothetical protein
MMRRDDRSRKSYRESVEGDRRELLEAVRKTILKLSPKPSESIQYGMLDFPGVACLAAQKHTVCLYVPPAVLANHKQNFPGVSAGKSCLRFRKLDQLDPAGLKKLLEAARKAG